MRLAATRNLLKVWGFVLVLCAGLGLLGWSGGGYPLLSSVVFCSLLATAAAYWYADRVVMGMVGARELALAEAPLLHSTLERLAARANVAKPKLYVIPDGHPRAFAAGRGPRGSAIAVSRGLLGAAPPAELEGVLAHELAHVRARDVVTQEGVVVFAAALVEATRIGGALQRLLLFVLGPIAAAPVHLLLSPKREFAADRFAAELCESPHGIADALLRLELAGELVEFRANPATEPLYTINPFEPTGLAAMFGTHPPTEERVRRLRELDPDWREKLRAA
ncbi:MAG: heat shock protein HtpX [Gaiellaceae bacterium]|jgi:heat shock protein HtpX|nr:heat shock protein HtpX [Gaiellaceae bacterium]